MVEEENLSKETIPRWSYSRLGTYESCPKKAYYRYIQHVPEEQHPAAERGIKIHGLAEQYIKGELEEVPRELYLFFEGFGQLQEDYQNGEVCVEEQWAFNLSWEKTDWDSEDTWGRYIIDAFVKQGAYAKIIDFKTGRFKGHNEGYKNQCTLYACCIFNRFPDVEKIDTELWYLDHHKITRYNFERSELQKIQDDFHKRGLKMTTDIEFNTTPSEFACRFCSFTKICKDNFYERS
jgi:CRISPR/Cas system-associated exonuclease Cas4 (RecB family)|tara:strand:+ start:2297 stop:3001 length:705 start_codon:yes stop_codon:yes gene_type:complete